jgi:hypothetical protein
MFRIVYGEASIENINIILKNYKNSSTKNIHWHILDIRSKKDAWV